MDREESKRTGVSGPRLSWRFWLLPTAAGALTILLLVAVYFLFFQERTVSILQREAVHAQAELGRIRALLHEGRFRLAVQEIAANKDAIVAAASPSEQREWQQLEREAGIYADLCAESLEELLEHAVHTKEDEWLAEFNHRYRGKAFIFDAPISRDQTGIHLDYDVRTGTTRAELVIDNLALVQRLNAPAPRAIFGARLLSMKLEPPGPHWVVRLIPDSDVLLTDATAAALCCPPFAEADSKRVIEEQRRIVQTNRE